MFLIKYDNNLSNLIKSKNNNIWYIFYINNRKCIIGEKNIKEIYKLNNRIIRI